jgi:hypothetical protein
MTVDTQLAEHFRAARWADSGGEPSCPKCFDGRDVRQGYRPLKGQPHLRVYHCRCCKYFFSDRIGTPLEHTVCPLAIWAFILLGGTPPEAIGKTQKWIQLTLRVRDKQMTDSSIVKRWLATLKEDASRRSVSGQPSPARGNGRPAALGRSRRTITA